MPISRNSRKHKFMETTFFSKSFKDCIKIVFLFKYQSGHHGNHGPHVASHVDQERQLGPGDVRAPAVKNTIQKQSPARQQNACTLFYYYCHYFYSYLEYQNK